MKISDIDHDKLRKIKHEFLVESYADAVSKLIEEHEKSQNQKFSGELEASA
jgi:hypothetical protein